MEIDSTLTENSLDEFIYISSSPSELSSISSADSTPSVLNLTVFSPSQRRDVYSPVVSFHTSEVDICVICLDEVIEDKLVLNCSHVFHGNCISSWFHLGHRNVRRKCPVCKERITIIRTTQSLSPSPVRSQIEISIPDEDLTDLDENICICGWQRRTFGISRINWANTRTILQCSVLTFTCYSYFYLYFLYVIVQKSFSLWANIQYMVFFTVTTGLGRIVYLLVTTEEESLASQRQRLRRRRSLRISPVREPQW